MSEPAVLSLGVARVADRCILGHFFSRCTSKQQKTFWSVFEEALHSVRPVGSFRSRVSCGNFSVYLFVESSARFAFGAVVGDSQFPERVAFRILTVSLHCPRPLVFAPTG